MTTRTLLAGGSALIDGRLTRADILIEDEKIMALSTQVKDAATWDAEKVDVHGAWILPGFIDSHVHAGAPFCDDISDVARAAARSGVTTIAVHAYPDLEGGDPDRSARELVEWATGNEVDAIIHWRLNRSYDLAEQVRAGLSVGITTFKAFLEYRPRGLMFSDIELYSAMKAIAAVGGSLIVHAVAGDLVEALEEDTGSDIADFLNARPPVTEFAAVQRTLELARLAGCRVVIAHVTSRRTVDLCRSYLRDDVGVETCPQFLLFTQKTFFDLGAPSRTGVPLREAADNRDLLAALGREIDMVGTDHAPYAPSEKSGTFGQAPNGFPGIQTLFHVMLDHVGPELAGKVCAAGPARVLGVEDRKGRIAVGMDADLVVVDPTATTTLTAADHLSVAGFTPFEGRVVKGRIVSTWLRGQVTVDGQARGQHLARVPWTR